MAQQVGHNSSPTPKGVMGVIDLLALDSTTVIRVTLINALTFGCYRYNSREEIEGSVNLGVVHRLLAIK